RGAVEIDRRLLVARQQRAIFDAADLVLEGAFGFNDDRWILQAFHDRAGRLASRSPVDVIDLFRGARELVEDNRPVGNQAAVTHVGRDRIGRWQALPGTSAPPHASASGTAQPICRALYRSVTTR